MACSYRFTGEFNVNIAAIRIIEREDRMGFDVELVDDPNEPFQCDGCVDYDIPYCVQFCHLRDELQRLINQFLESQKVSE